MATKKAFNCKVGYQIRQNNISWQKKVGLNVAKQTKMLPNKNVPDSGDGPGLDPGVRTGARPRGLNPGARAGNREAGGLAREDGGPGGRDAGRRK